MKPMAIMTTEYYINDYDEPVMNWGNFISGFRLPNYLSKVTMTVFSQQNTYIKCGKIISQ